MPVKPVLGYQVHLAQLGWRQGFVYDGMATGTTGLSLRIEAIQIRGLPAGFQYRGQVQGKGWMDWVNPGETAGTTADSLRLEAIQFRSSLPSNGVQIWGRAHVEGKGWMPVTCPMGSSYLGTVGQSKRMEAIQLLLVYPAHDLASSPGPWQADAQKILATAPAEQPSVGWVLDHLLGTWTCIESLATVGAVCGVTGGWGCLLGLPPSTYVGLVGCAREVSGSLSSVFNAPPPADPGLPSIGPPDWTPEWLPPDLPTPPYPPDHLVVAPAGFDPGDAGDPGEHGDDDDDDDDDDDG